MRTKSVKGGWIENKVIEMFIFAKGSEVFGTYYIRGWLEARPEVNGSD
jgi:hypothetical protein